MLEHERSWGTRAFITLGLTALWCGASAVGFAIKYDEESRRGGLTIPLWTFVWAAVFAVGGTVGWCVATIQAVVGIVRPATQRRIAAGALFVCALALACVVLVVLFWDKVHPPPPQFRQGLHGDML